MQLPNAFATDSCRKIAWNWKLLIRYDRRV